MGHEGKHTQQFFFSSFFTSGFTVVAISALLACSRPINFLYPPAYSGRHVTDPRHVRLVTNENKLRPVDIVWIIDNSDSMAFYQSQLMKNANGFIQEFAPQYSHTSWQMGILSTSVDEDPYLGFAPTNTFNDSNPDPTGTFVKAVSRLGINGDNNERAFEPLQNALSKYPAFFRKDAVLAIIVVTDVDDSQMTSSDFDRVNPRALAQSLIDLKGGDKSKILMYGLFASLDLNCQPEFDPLAKTFTFNFKGSRYSELFSPFNNKIYPACDPGMGKNLADLGHDIVSHSSFTSEFVLTDQPDIGSIWVEYAGKDLPPGTAENGGMWIYQKEGNLIRLATTDFLFADQNDITIHYHTK